MPPDTRIVIGRGGEGAGGVGGERCGGCEGAGGERRGGCEAGGGGGGAKVKKSRMSVNVGSIPSGK